MKGGYQIIDLSNATAGSAVTLSGIYKRVSGNNSKPLMIVTPDGQRVFSEVVEDDGVYITTYISAEGKTVKVQIENTDEVTITISDPGASITGLEQAVNEIAGNVGDVDDLTTTSKVLVGAVNELNSSKQNKITMSYSGWYGVISATGESGGAAKRVYVTNPFPQMNPVSASIRRAESPGHETYDDVSISSLTETGCYVNIPSPSTTNWSVIIVKFQY